MGNAKEKNLIEMAEQQLTGFAHAKRGYSIVSLVESMGLKKDEWEKIKRQYKPTYLLKDEWKDINEYFKK